MSRRIHRVWNEHLTEREMIDHFQKKIEAVPLESDNFALTIRLFHQWAYSQSVEGRHIIFFINLLAIGNPRWKLVVEVWKKIDEEEGSVEGKAQ